MVKLIVSERRIDEMSILDLSGDVTLGEGNVMLRTAIGRLLGEGQKKIILNMEKVGYVDSESRKKRLFRVFGANKKKS